MAEHSVTLGYNETVDIKLPDGQTVSVLLSYLEPGEQSPEIDIMLPSVLCVNVFGEGLAPAEPVDVESHVLLAKQIIVPL